MLYERKGFLQSLASIFIQGSKYADYNELIIKNFSEAANEDLRAISKDFEKALNDYTSRKNPEKLRHKKES